MDDFENKENENIENKVAFPDSTKDSVLNDDNRSPLEFSGDVKDAQQDEESNDPDNDFVIGRGFNMDYDEDENGSLDNIEGKKERKRKKKKNRTLRTIIWVVSIFAFASLFAYLLITVASDILGIGKDKICQITINEGMTTTQIADTLKDEGAINHPLVFRLYSKLKGYDGTYRYGTYEFNNSKGYDGIISDLQTGNTFETVMVRIPEKATIDEIIKILDENDVCTKAQFKEAMNDRDYHYEWVKGIPVETVRYRFEGYLYPDTYSFFVGESVDNAQRAIEKMLNNFNSKLPDDYNEQAEKLGYSFHEVMSMASIVELEANGFPDEASKVAAVFYNRLKWDEPKYLGSTPTYDYPDNRYNTNAPDGNDSTEDGYEGLPPGPQCSPSIASIEGALSPQKNFSSTYFVTDTDMKFYYTDSYNEHLNLINRLKSQGKFEY